MATNNHNDAVNVFNLVSVLSKTNPHFSLQNRKCRQDFLAFLKNNNHFGVQQLYLPIDCNNDENAHWISRTDAENIKPNLKLWLQSYGIGDDEKLGLLINRMQVLHPETGALFAKFIKHGRANSSSAWKLADYLCYELDIEIAKMSNDELDGLANKMDKELPLNSARMFSEFLMYAREREHLSNGWIYSFNSRREIGVDGAYSTLDFLKMAYIVFNHEAWTKECLCEKALESEKDANLWLFIACHFICGWRGTDIIRLPLPAIPNDSALMREQISNECFDAESIVCELEFRLRYKPLMPKKTEAYENVLELKLFVPESLRKPFGIILAIAASHHKIIKPGEVFLKKAGDRMHILSFFGECFVNACGSRGFSSRRANKSYLQGIEMVADTSSSRPKGYMLAALARSHKGGVGALPETTDIYLRDAKFAGYRPDFIAREMFERGVFSFIPALMMEMYANNSYTKLPIPLQTKVLAEIGIEASGLEGLTKTVEHSLIKARNAIAEIMKRPEDIRGSISDILQNIASGNAPGKQDGFLCLMTASGSFCVDAERSSCIGCGYEIYTKTILHCLAREYARLLAKKGDADQAEAVRCTKILKNAVMPAIAEMFASIKRLYSDADIKTLINTTEMGAMLC